MWMKVDRSHWDNQEVGFKLLKRITYSPVVYVMAHGMSYTRRSIREAWQNVIFTYFKPDNKVAHIIYPTGRTSYRGEDWLVA